ncbi:MAG: methionyl-tRNA formyltransferase [Planctomycetota bacterium]|jgi:methionyl-tRNA formyltransferase
MNTQSSHLSILFFGTPELCIPILQGLQEAGFDLSSVVTAPDRPVGRKQVLTSPPVKIWATERGIQVLQPEKLDDAAYATLEALRPDISIVVAYGQIMPQRFIDLPTHGTINIHYSLLPAWRGASPVEHTILEGEPETGVTIQKMVHALDAGPSISSARIELDGTEFAPDLKEVLTEIGTDLLVETLPEYLNGNITPSPQRDEDHTMCYKIGRADGEINLSWPAKKLWRYYRAYYGWPGIFLFDEEKKRVKITEAEYDEETETFTILKVIPEGKKEMEYTQFTNI